MKWERNGWSGHIGAKPPSSHACSDPGVRAILSVMTKAQLADLAAQTIALAEGHADDPITVDELLRHAEPFGGGRGKR